MLKHSLYRSFISYLSSGLMYQSVSQRQPGGSWKSSLFNSICRCS